MSNSIYFPNGGACPVCNGNTDAKCYCEWDTLGIKTEQRNEFHIKQVYDVEYPETLICNCGNDKFTVGLGSYFTAAKCTSCGLEVCVHDG